ncbi:hypothetical protein [Pedobacter panaciterrae]
MCKILQHEHNGTKWLFVPTNDLYVRCQEYMGYLIMIYHNEANFVSTRVIENPVLCANAVAKHNPDKDFKEVPVKLPDGNWHIQFTTKDMMSEVEWKPIVRYAGLPWCAYVDYRTNKNWFDNAKDAGLSLITSLGGDPSKNYVVLNDREK